VARSLVKTSAENRNRARRLLIDFKRVVDEVFDESRANPGDAGLEAEHRGQHPGHHDPVLAWAGVVRLKLTCPPNPST
jgi:hypothetical protein